ncbi:MULTISPECIES: response regulator [Aeromonas]|jgi:two-component system, OmpR family, response regulator|uniref:Response regulator transcription factor n=2 Tax=Aeromonas TaxID=642 RepID=A0A6M4YE02_AERME|nr:MULTISPECIES: response regulator transcription factor [Aeromonas]MBP6792741.1 response regulator transcription factor [Aeromonas sp.]AVP93002.1 DNA-binding response regulator [Aeromonas rivipollensis]EOD56855.1 two-component response regulator [Aeromonas molluscorum 848]MBP8268990.1 response regulator transcription factor [Aeromonas sp.]MBP8280108.1 response regulator transcription factor [Aeromonas sp.]
MDSKVILIVDDSQALTDTLTEYLGRAGFEVRTACDGEAMWQQVRQGMPDLVILDVMLPGDDGFTLCSQLRRLSNVPIMMLTAVTEDADRIAGLEIGADDYLTKSFNPRELLARIKALLRRSRLTQQAATARRISFGPWTLDSVTRQLSRAGEAPRQLSGADYTLLGLFIRHPNELLSRDLISQEIWGRESDPFERGIDVQVSRLRQALDDKDRTLIMTVRNKGYMLATETVYEA